MKQKVKINMYYDFDKEESANFKKHWKQPSFKDLEPFFSFATKPLKFEYKLADSSLSK